MTYTNAKYAAMAIQANEQGKRLVDNNGVLELQNIVRSAEEISASNESIIKLLKSEAIDEIKILEHENDTNALTLWKTYYKELKALDTSVEKMDLPEKPS